MVQNSAGATSSVKSPPRGGQRGAAPPGQVRAGPEPGQEEVADALHGLNAPRTGSWEILLSGDGNCAWQAEPVASNDQADGQPQVGLAFKFR